MSQKSDAEWAAMRTALLQQVEGEIRLLAPLTGRATLAPALREAMAQVPRHEFLPEPLQPYAYENMPLPLGCGKTISQPFIIALMTELLEIAPHHKVLEIGTGLGYHAAILAELSRHVFSVELVAELADEARRRLDRLGYQRIETRLGEGSRGWAEAAPFDRITLAAAPERIPPRLLEQLVPGGRMVLPLGPEGEQRLTLVVKTAGGELRQTPVLDRHARGRVDEVMGDDTVGGDRVLDERERTRQQRKEDSAVIGHLTRRAPPRKPRRKFGEGTGREVQDAIATPIRKSNLPDF
jgi:protein-L-isoaspartate(D-aspartate) O-methyltransferase